MTTPECYRPPSYDELVAEQQRAQIDKFQGRQLAEYNSTYVFPGADWRVPRSNETVDFIRQQSSPTVNTIQDYLRNKLQGNNGLHWADIACGRALAIRQASCIPDIGKRVQITGVDLFDYGFDGLKKDELDYLQKNTPNITDPELVTIIENDAETVALPAKADLITSIESIQYLNSPLQAICNWYNQLNDNGIMIVAAGHNWSSSIRRRDEYLQPKKDTLTIVFEHFKDEGIEFAKANELDSEKGVRLSWPNTVRQLVIKKKPNTELAVAVPQIAVELCLGSYKATYYDSGLTQSAITVGRVAVKASEPSSATRNLSVV